MQSSSTLCSDFSKISKDNESTSNLKNLKFEKKYSVQINQMRGSLVLTKMPQKTEENSEKITEESSQNKVETKETPKNTKKNMTNFK